MPQSLGYIVKTHNKLTNVVNLEFCHAFSHQTVMFLFIYAYSTDLR